MRPLIELVDYVKADPVEHGGEVLAAVLVTASPFLLWLFTFGSQNI